MYFTPGDAQNIFARWGFIPYEVSHFVDIGPQNAVAMPLTIFTSLFIHGGWLHLLGNMLYLWVFGDNVEDRLGHFSYLFFYLACGVSAAVVHGFVNIESKVPSVGASGAIAGVLGAYLFLFPGARINTLLIIFIFVKIIKLPALIVLGLWIVVQFLSGLAELGLKTVGGIAWFAHIEGFFSGAILALAMKRLKARDCLRG